MPCRRSIILAATGSITILALMASILAIKCLASAVESSVEDAFTFTKTNVLDTANMIANSLEDFGEDLESAAKWTKTAYGDSADDIGDLAAPAVAEIAEFGTDLVNVAEAVKGAAFAEFKSVGRALIADADRSMRKTTASVSWSFEKAA